MKQRILVVEDDPSILTGLVDLLEGEGFIVVQATDGVAALARHAEARPDIVLLDVMIPEKNGYDVCREIRRADAVTPVIMLTAKGEEVDKVVGLELGADDYVVKPFGVNELLARIRAVLRRGRPKTDGRDEQSVQFADVCIDPRTLRFLGPRRRGP
ncbi:MAG: response regulator transcription factor [Spirochaetia bacterium]